MQAVEKWFDKNHNTLVRFGGLFCFCFIMVYVPFSLIVNSKSALEEQKQVNSQLVSQIAELNTAMAGYKQAFLKQQKVQAEIDCLAQNIYFEASTEPMAGKVAVAEVTLNRVKQGFSDSVCGVVKQKKKGVCQFSWVCSPKKKPQVYSTSWKQSVKIAENALTFGKKSSIIKGATYYHAEYVEPNWATSKQLVAKIGSHVFYKD